MAANTRRRNFRLFEYLVSVMSDAELRTMRDCVAAEWDFRVNRARGLASSIPPAEDETIGPDDELGPMGDEPEAEPTSRPSVSRRPPSPERTTSPSGQALVNRRHGSGQHAANNPGRGQTGMRRVPPG